MLFTDDELNGFAMEEAEKVFGEPLHITIDELYSRFWRLLSSITQHTHTDPFFLLPLSSTAFIHFATATHVLKVAPLPPPISDLISFMHCVDCLRRWCLGKIHLNKCRCTDMRCTCSRRQFCVCSSLAHSLPHECNAYIIHTFGTIVIPYVRCDTEHTRPTYVRSARAHKEIYTFCCIEKCRKR